MKTGVFPWKEARVNMPKIVVREKESIEDALRRFKRDVSRSGNLQEAKKRQYYLKPSDVRKQKRQEARKKYK
jgi:small subunit ribosomal protein S21